MLINWFNPFVYDECMMMPQPMWWLTTLRTREVNDWYSSALMLFLRSNKKFKKKQKSSIQIVQIGSYDPIKSAIRFISSKFFCTNKLRQHIRDITRKRLERGWILISCHHNLNPKVGCILSQKTS